MWSTIIGFVLIAIGFIGCFVHKIPGPLLAFAGILVFHFGNGSCISTTALILCAVAVIISMVLGHYMPKITKRIHEFGKGGKAGAIIGSLLGLIAIAGAGSADIDTGLFIVFIITGLVIIPFAFAYIGEMIARKSAKEALMPAVAAYITYFTGMVIKLAVCAYCIYAVIDNM